MNSVKTVICVCVALAGVFLAGRWSVKPAAQSVELHDRLTFPSPGPSEAYAYVMRQSCTPTLITLEQNCRTECSNKWGASTTRDVVLNGQIWSPSAVCADGCYKMLSIVSANCPVNLN